MAGALAREEASRCTGCFGPSPILCQHFFRKPSQRELDVSFQRELGQLCRYHTNNSSNVDISSFWLMPLCLPTVISNELSSPPDYASSRPDLGHCQHDSHRVSDQSCRTPLWARLLSTSVASSSLDEKAQALLCEISAISKSHVVLQPACIRPIVD
jgi:hypothetical protein